MRVSSVVIACLLASALLPAIAFGHEPPAASARHPLLSWHPLPWRPATPAIGAGLRAEVDPATGEWVTPRATPVPLETAIGRMREAGLTVVTRADGSRFVTVGDRLHKWSVVSEGPDGALRHACVNSEDEAIARARAAAANAKGGR